MTPPRSTAMLVFRALTSLAVLAALAVAIGSPDPKTRAGLGFPSLVILSGFAAVELLSDARELAARWRR